MNSAVEREVSKSYFCSFVFDVPSMGHWAGLNGSAMILASTPRKYCLGVGKQSPPWLVAGDGAPRCEVLGEVAVFQRNTGRDLESYVKHSPQSAPLPSKLPLEWETHLSAAL